MVTKTIPELLILNPLQQWSHFKQPVLLHSWLRKRYGDMAFLRFQGLDVVGILTSEGIRQVFLADSAIYDVFWKESFIGLSGEDVLWTMTGERHRLERQLISPAFHPSNYRGYGETIRSVTRRHLEQWQAGKIVRAIDTTASIWLDVIMQLVFGLEDGIFFDEGRNVHKKLWRSMHPLIVFFPRLQRPWFPLWARYTRAKAEFADWVHRYLVERRAIRQAADDVLGHILAARDEQGQPVTDAHIRDEFISILGAGHETAATGLAWALYELGRHPEVLMKLRSELQDITDESDIALLLKLPYLSAVCNETLRLHPILAECARVANEPLEILGRAISPGQALLISIAGVHHDPTLYPEPDQFIPQRFIDNKYRPYEFLPFGGGHRHCLGAGLAEYFIRIALVEIILHWEFEPAGVDRDIRHDIAMGSKKGVPLRIKGRRPPVKES